MIKNYLNMKKNEWKIKAMLYNTIITLIDNQKELLELLQKMYSALKDVPTDEFREEFISKLVEIIHESEE
jgi:hypothetical protein